ncbi:Nto1p KNAG_0B02140 [Huiozyma naganishii CBS 8797]|uniref:PHD-type domain-containing protein n=1 Tax=Huiozyma naganishii (strain ATCC MYA-139 / BCRC 22969 / CBS 8797 / KCTC 17520 / NBRC 10181 / NCYC 3082 / Yp74L-3) TaxID=1071383 RepID=J7S4L8_HUIN7|nr:hypothetical protein KNAG_0B02140 [Kazachstania naganishii CBS 8797]CCK68656.1 hypothetical protein KNAG_0B02140 [Kazachstania naganishii CBS 8797]
MASVGNTNDDGPKLREEKQYRDFYPLLEEDTLLPIIDGHCNSSGISSTKEVADLIRHPPQVKQLIFNGKVTTEPLIIEQPLSSYHKCTTELWKLKEKKNAHLSHKKKWKPSPKSEINRIVRIEGPQEGTAYKAKLYQRKILPDMDALKIIEPTLTRIKTLYDMDEQDYLYMQYLRKQFPTLTLTDLQFEILLTILEIRYAITQSHVPTLPPPPPTIDQLCSICNGVETTHNTIVFCDCCNLAVHQDCYGVIFIPTGPWLCRACLQGKFESKRPRCAVCPEVGGALKQSTCGSWVHVSCAVWINELCFGNWHYAEPIEGIDRIPLSRWRLNCYLCKQRTGACIQCCNRNCFVAYHVSCARRVGLDMTPLVTGSLAEMALNNGERSLESFCDRHCASPSSTYKAAIADLRNFYSSTRQSDVHPNEKIIIPQAFSETLQRCVLSFNSIGHKQISTAVSVQICKYWALKRENNEGAPLISLPSEVIDLSYNLLTDKEIENRLEFIDILLHDLQKIQKLTDLVCERDAKILSLREVEEKIKSIVTNREVYCIQKFILGPFLQTEQFKTLETYLKDGKPSKSIVRCQTGDFANINELKIEMDGFFRLVESTDVPRTLRFTALKAEHALINLITKVEKTDFDRMLDRDFVLNRENPFATQEREWIGPFLQREEELSSVEDLTENEVHILTGDIWENAESSASITENTPSEQRTLKRKQPTKTNQRQKLTKSVKALKSSRPDSKLDNGKKKLTQRRSATRQPQSKAVLSADPSKRKTTVKSTGMEPSGPSKHRNIERGEKQKPKSKLSRKPAGTKSIH